MSVELLLPVFADGEYHSGEELGELLGVSRAAVWKQVKKLEELLGVKLESVKGRGYCLVGGLSLLDKESIAHELVVPDCARPLEFELLSVTESTNRLAMDWGQSGVAGCGVFVAEKQTEGRGRRGRVWQSPYGRNLYFSLSWEFAGGVAALEGLSLAVGVGLVEVLEQFGGQGVSLKWPNDVIFDGKKLAGILLEMVGDPSGVCRVGVGIGVNIDMPSELSVGIDQPWIDLSAISGDRVDRSALLVAMINRLFALLADYERLGFAFYRDRWCAHDGFSGEQVRVLRGADYQQGVARGVDQAGALILELSDGEFMTFNGGEVSLRKSDDT
jgi:BirA family biotin operon repressor/biotin-[acetyl-CoA-carboxylase] ligase